MAGVTTSYQTGNHASRPAAGAGCILYDCTDHGLIYRSDGTTWITFATLGTAGAYVAGGTDVPVADGGTGSSTASGARTNLGLAIGTDVQAFDAELAAVAGLASAANKVPYFTGSGTAAVADFTAAGRALVDDADASAQRTTLGLGTMAVEAKTITTQDDLLIGGAAGALDRLAKGSDSQVLTVDPTTHHLVWATPSSGFSNPMTTKGDVIVGDTGGSAIRKAVGSDGQVLTADAASTGGIKWAAGGAGGGITQAYVGYNTAGGTWGSLGTFRHYMKKITLASAAMIVSVDAYVRPSTDNVLGIAAGVMTDNAGSPDILIAGCVSAGNGMYLSNSGSMPGAGRWLSIPVGIYLAAGDYWIVFMGSNGNIDLASDGSGSDRYFTSSVYALSGTYPSAFAVTTTALKYSIRANTFK